ncbi:MAG: hypothetical protein WCE21_03415 [Candidatus Babeliales bacterium]
MPVVPRAPKPFLVSDKLSKTTCTPQHNFKLTPLEGEKFSSHSLPIVPYKPYQCKQFTEQCKQQEEKQRYKEKEEKRKDTFKRIALGGASTVGIAVYCDVVNQNMQEHTEFFNKEAAELEGMGATTEKYLELAQNAVPDSMLADLYYATHFSLAGDLWQAKQYIASVNKKVGIVKEIQQKLACQQYIEAARKTWENSAAMIDAGRTVHVLNSTNVMQLLVRASILHTYTLCGTYNVMRVGHMRTKPEKVQEIEWHHVLVNRGLNNIITEMNSVAEIPGYNRREELLQATEKMEEFMLNPSYEQYLKVKKMLPIVNK